MADPGQQPEERSTQHQERSSSAAMGRVTFPRILLAVVGVLTIGALGYLYVGAITSRNTDSKLGEEEPTRDPSPFMFSASAERPPRMMVHENLTLHWDQLPASMLRDLQPTSSISNIRPQDYIGPDACKSCHKKQYDNWSQHPHRWMNALAGSETVKGDFSGEATLLYQGARGFFYRESDQYRMKIERNGVTHVYQIEKTLGSRFFQYYIGRGIEGPPPEGHDVYYREEHVLPFGYWIDRRMWVPIVHVAIEHPDEGGRWNPLDPPFELTSEKADLVYANRCSICHTTYPIGDNLVRQPEFSTDYLSTAIHFSVASYTARSHPELWDGSRDTHDISSEEMYRIVGRFSEFQTLDQAATLGISCEACHLGARGHAEGKQTKPSFLAQGDDLRTSRSDEPTQSGRVHGNVNWVCSRCHVGERPAYASGVSTWNSVEFSDAARGACYAELTCIDCHDPHTAIGKKWSKLPAQDDAVCLTCHQQYQEQKVRQKHTHHLAGSEGDRCLNCHMPRINEGLQDAVRTHMIYSPTRSDMIEAGHPNACNLCHLDKPIDWTLKQLKEWFGKEYDEASIAEAYPQRELPVGIVWLNHASSEATRLVAVDAMTKANAKWGLAELVKVLDDEFLLNRQFAQKGLEDMLVIRLIDWDYRFYMTKAERHEPLERLREELLKEDDR
jgi:predicted CXXCH cytochrome family protein